MKLRNFANKFLLVTILVVLAVANCLVGCAPTQTVVSTADANITQLNKSYYYFDQVNKNKPSGANETLYDALGIKVYDDYLSALSATQSLNEVVIAVVDTGLDMSCPVFENRILEEYAMDFSSGAPRKSNTGELLNNNWNVDENGHGTHVAGIIADATLSNVKILPIKIFGETGNTTANGTYAFQNALRYLAALKRGIRTSLLYANGHESAPQSFFASKVYYNSEMNKLPNLVAVNLSLGTPGYEINSSKDMSDYADEKPSYQNLIDQYLRRNNILPIIAAGNRSSSERNNQPYYSLPGACEHVLEVSAYDNTHTQYALADFSYFNDYVSVAAPGSNIWSACTSSIYEQLTVSDIKPLLGAKPNEVYYEHNYGSTNNPLYWRVLKVKDNNNQDVYYYCSSGTSMATPFVTACYALLMSDSSKNSAEDYGLTNWNPESEDDAKFYNAAHKALLAAAATDGEGSETYDIKFGYGTVNVSGFVPDSSTHVVRELEDIDYEPQYDSNYENLWSRNTTTEDNNGSVDWFSVCLILLVCVILFWGFNTFRAYLMRRQTKDDEQQ